MSRVDFLVRLGGLLTVLVFVHFVVDWIFQSHAEAMRKHDHPWVRARHCAIYTVPFVPLMVWAHVPWAGVLVGAATLFFSHFVEDTYLPVFVWAKYVRRPPEMEGDPRKGFLAFVSTPLGKILMIAVDQIIHIGFLLPVAWIILRYGR